ncbi:MAG: ESX secretion-associated protein EspG [Sciscionella sp.]
MVWQQVTVTVTALSRMVRRQRLGELHPILEPAAVWMSPDAGGEADDVMWAEFARMGLVAGPGRLAPEALDALSTLAHPAVAYFAVFTYRQKQYATLVAGVGGGAVLAFRDGDRVELTGLRRESLPETLLRQLPEMPAADIDSLNVRIAHLAAGGAAAGAGPSAAKDAAALARLGEEPLLGQGELYVGIRDRHGRQRVTEDPIRYHDIQAGRIIVIRSPGYLSVAPATTRLFLDHLHRAHQELTE